TPLCAALSQQVIPGELAQVVLPRPGPMLHEDLSRQRRASRADQLVGLPDVSHVLEMTLVFGFPRPGFVVLLLGQAASDFQPSLTPGGGPQENRATRRDARQDKQGRRVPLYRSPDLFTLTPRPRIRRLASHELSEVIGEVAGGAIPPSGVLLQAFQADGLEVA